MFDEYNNRNAPEFNSQVENKVTKENVFAVENRTAKENINVKENLELDGKSHKKAEKIKARNKALSILTTSVVGVVGLVVAGMTNLVNIKLKAKFIEDKVEYRDGKIAYSINVSNLTEKEYIVVYPERDTKELKPVTHYLADVEDGVIRGSINVEADYIEKQLASVENGYVRYVLNLRGLVGLDVERLFDRYVVKIEKVTESKFEDVTGYCNCGVDGYYYFKLNFEDEVGHFSDFNAYIYDSVYEELESRIENTSDEVEIARLRSEQEKHISRLEEDKNRNWHEEQRLFVLDLQGSKGTLVIEYQKEENGVKEPMKVVTPIEL